MNVNLHQLLPDEKATLALASQLSHHITAPLVVTLSGTLGAGKTTFCRGLLRGLGHQGNVKSPTYTLVESYHFDSFELHHFDLYRMGNPSECEEMGIEEYFNPQAIVMVEWPENGGDWVNPVDISIELRMMPKGREISIQAHSARGRHCIKELNCV